MILTIGIPVLNGSDHISNTLQSILRESDLIDEEIELLVVDNKSEDGTQQILSDFYRDHSASSNLNIKIKLNETNQGLDNSINHLIEESSGDYIWMLGAQEVLHFGALRIVIDLLREKPWQVVLNSTMWDEASNREIQDNLYGRKKDLIFHGLNDFFSEIGGPCLSLSANISRAEPLRKRRDIETKTRYWGWYERWIDVAIANERDGDFVFVAKPLIQILVEAKGWQATGKDTSGSQTVVNAQTVYFTFVELTEIAKRKFDLNPTIRDSMGAYRDHFGVPRAIALAKATGLSVKPGVVFRSAQVFGFTPWFWFVGIPVLFTPKFLLNLKVISLMRKFIHFLRFVLRAPAK
jgi:glycosyltransferase involved in cell wall biosynthesis